MAIMADDGSDMAKLKQLKMVSRGRLRPFCAAVVPCVARALDFVVPQADGDARR